MGRTWKIAVGVATPEGWFGVKVKTTDIPDGGSKHDHGNADYLTDGKQQDPEKSRDPAHYKKCKGTVSIERRRRRPRR